MDGKITLITPPDIFENGNTSLLFVNLSETDQTNVSTYLANLSSKQNFNFYVYGQDNNLLWLMYAINRSNFVYIDFNSENLIVDRLGSYILSKNNVFYKTDNENLAAIYNHINQNRITNIETFLQKACND